MEYAIPVPVWALNDAQLSRLEHERDELREFLNAEARSGRDLRPPSMNARARLRDVERQIQMAEDSRRGGAMRRSVHVNAQNATPARRQQYAEPVPYWKTSREHDAPNTDSWWRGTESAIAELNRHSGK
jgi:hypothetical protein